MPPTETLRTSTNATRLLVSIRNREEAELAIRHGVYWIDVKEPRTGALGRPSLDSAMDIYSSLENHACRSVALGELHDLPNNAGATREALRLAELFPVAKVGMSNLSNANWQSSLQKLQNDIELRGCQLVPVFYADGSNNGAPNWKAIIRFLDDQQRTGVTSTPRRLLIDTFVKDGKNLLAHLPIAQIQTCLADCQRRGINLVLAGSLRAEQISLLLSLGAEAIGVRGAVCEPNERSSEAHSSSNHNPSSQNEDQTRTGSLSPEKLRTITRLFEMTSESTPIGC